MANQPPQKPAKPAPRPAAPAAANASQQQALADKARQSAAEAHDEDDEFEEEGGMSRFMMFAAVPSWLVSMVVHILLLIVLAFLQMPKVEQDPILRTQTAVEEPEPEVKEELEEEKRLDETKVEELNLDTTTVAPKPAPPMAQPDVEQVHDEPIGPADDPDAAPPVNDFESFDPNARKTLMSKTLGTLGGTGLSGRGKLARGQLVRERGGNKASEAAVAAALKWLAEHQLPDGGWSWDHRGGRCNGRCGNHGSLGEARTGATAMALLPFLGAGQTHLEGEYKQTVKAGLAFLLRRAKIKGQMADFTEPGGRMYSHGLASIVLTEAYGMTHDKQLHQPAQMALNFIMYAQDPAGGGWRYTPRQAGDTSVVGWQLMALKSGAMAYLNVPPVVTAKASRFLDAVQSDSGAKYGYTGPGAGQATSAIGLLCRMYLRWKKEHPALERGVKFLSGIGPSKGNCYYNYYATQVMSHYEGPMWDKWNKEMRDYLVQSQSKNGHEMGSWYFRGGDHGTARGGRLYATAMSCMVLEVYYRHMPIYKQQAAKEAFPL